MAKPTAEEKIPAGRVPALLFTVIDGVARRALGASDATGEALAREVRALSELYTQRRAEIGEEDRTRLVAARLRFFMPRDLPKVALPLFELQRAGLLPRDRSWRVLDLGAGLGTTSVGVARFARAVDLADELSVTAVDLWAEGLAIFESLAAKLPAEDFAGLRVETRVQSLDRAAPKGPFDLILLGLSLNEWARGRSPEDAALLLARLGDVLSPEGAMVVLEPALRDEARFVQRTRDAIAKRGGALGIFAPCVSPAPCPMLANERDWCHAELGGELEGPLAEIARRAGLRRSRRTFAYLTLRCDGQSARGIAGPEARGYRVVSEVLASKGKREVFVCGDGALVRLRLMKRDRNEANADFADLMRGDLVEMERALPSESGALRLEASDPIRRSR